MAQREQQTGGLTDRLPIARGAALGAAAYVVGYLVSYLFVEIDDELTIGEIGVADFDVETVDLVGWVFYNAHFVDFEFTFEGGEQSQSQSVSILSEVPNLTVPEPIWYLVPVVTIVGAGYLAARMAEHYGDTGTAAKAGATVLAGYFPLAVAGAIVFSESSEQSGLGQTVSVSVGPELMMAILLAGIVFPLVLGGIGGAIAASTGSSSGRPPGRHHQQRPPQQGQQPPQGPSSQQQQGSGGQQRERGQQQGRDDQDDSPRQ